MYLNGRPLEEEEEVLHLPVQPTISLAFFFCAPQIKIYIHLDAPISFGIGYRTIESFSTIYPSPNFMMDLILFVIVVHEHPVIISSYAMAAGGLVLHFSFIIIYF
jgi:hypothetical protein